MRTPQLEEAYLGVVDANGMMTPMEVLWLKEVPDAAVTPGAG
jgi:hypothetical protein